MHIELSDTDLLLRLTNFEDHFVERKTSGDNKDWLKTVVGFANSAPIGYPAVLYIGVRDGGEVEADLNLDSLQKSLSKKLADAYPPVFYICKVLHKERREFLAVIVPGSEQRPHFAGPSYVRVGSQTLGASEAQFQALIAQRQSKTYEILRWKGRCITVEYIESLDDARILGRPSSFIKMAVVDCNTFYVTLSKDVVGGIGRPATESLCIPLGRVALSFDTNCNWLKLEIAHL